MEKIRFSAPVNPVTSTPGTYPGGLLLISINHIYNDRQLISTSLPVYKNQTKYSVYSCCHLALMTTFGVFALVIRYQGLGISPIHTPSKNYPKCQKPYLVKYFVSGYVEFLVWPMSHLLTWGGGAPRALSRCFGLSFGGLSCHQFLNPPMVSTFQRQENHFLILRFG